MTGWLFAVSGAAAGVAQARLLEKAVGRGLHPFGLLVRLGLVAVILFLAARSGHLVSGAAGWIAGFAITAAIVHRGLR